MPRTKYDLDWPDDTDDLEIEMYAIQHGGRWTDASDGQEHGEGLIHHYEEMRKILWPHIDAHRWYILCRDEVITNKVTVLMGPKSSGKTMTPSWIYLCTYFCFPDETCILVSSTDMRGLNLRAWAEIKMLWDMAVRKFDYLPGHLLESKNAITTDNIDEKAFDRKKVRDLRKGIIGIPCIQNGKFVGLGKYMGIKQKIMRLLADEAQFMGPSFLSAFSNLDGNPDFRACICGNPSEILDPLGKAAEPRDGWGSHLMPTKTDVWETKFMGGRCVNLIGTDSPNFDFPEDEPTRYKYLIGRETIANTLSFFPKDSIEYLSQCVGAMKIGLLARRVITRDLCRNHKALEEVVWMGTPLTKIFALDAAYGGDRCIGGHIEWGLDVNSHMILNIVPPEIVPVMPKAGMEVEDVIAEWVRDYCEQNQIDAENVFHDSTGRGSLGTALARAWSAQCNPVEFGGEPTDRQVSLDMYVIDPNTGKRRLVLCSEYYSKFVTELWFSVRYAIEAEQVRGLTEEVMDEGCMREWGYWKGKKRLESKEEMKVRAARSPDLFDWLSIAVEGARRRGFQISKLASADEEPKNRDWMEDLQRKQRELRARRRLNYAA